LTGASDDTVMGECQNFTDESADTIATGQASNDNEGTSDAARKIEMEQILKEQTEATRSWLAEIAESPDLDELSQAFARTTAAIIRHWQEHAKGENPTSHIIDFGTGLKINLLMVLAILPERYQNGILIEDKNRSPSGDGDAASWLHEDTMNLLVGLFHTQDSRRVFGQGLASMISNDIDESWKEWYEKSYLEHQIEQMSNNELSEQEMKLYQYPDRTEKIIFFFNPTGIHWTLVEVDLSQQCWTYTLYNSLSQGRRGSTWKACKRRLPLLEHLICRVSGFPEPESRAFIMGTSVQQKNHYDCGPIAVYNAIELLGNRRPSETIDAEHHRLCYLTKILSCLQRSAESSPSIES